MKNNKHRTEHTKNGLRPSSFGVITSAFFSTILFLGVVPMTAMAASTNWTTMLPVLALYGTKLGDMCPRITCQIDMDSGLAITVPAWVTAGAINPPTVNINYSATVKNNTTSASGDNPAVKVGDSISFLPTAYSGTDITWSTTGYNIDTPYGNWSSSGTVTGCDASTLVGTNSIGSGYYSAMYWGYISLNVTPTAPTITKGGTATLACDGSGFNCTVTGAGTISATITWPATSGVFAYAYTKTGSDNVAKGFYLPTGTCVDAGPLSINGGSNYDMAPPHGLINNAQGAPYIMAVPNNSVSFSLTAAPTINVSFSFLDRVRSFFGGLFAEKAFAQDE